MIQRIQSLWMVLTSVMTSIVLFMPVIYFSLGGAEFHLLPYGIKSISGEMLMYEGEVVQRALTTSTLSLCVGILIAVCALLPLVTLFFYKRRMVQIRLLSAEFILLAGAVGLLAYYIYIIHRDIVSVMSSNFYFSFYPLLIIVAILTNWFAVRAVMRDEMLVRSLDRIR